MLMAQDVSRRPFTAKSHVQSQPVHVIFVIDKTALGNTFIRLWNPSSQIHSRPNPLDFSGVVKNLQARLPLEGK
jgi:hypothetical protein